MQSQRGLWGKDGLMHKACSHLGLSKRAWQVGRLSTCPEFVCACA